MKILLVSDYATPTAGCEIMLLMMRDGLRARGHEVRMFANRAALIPGESFADYSCAGTHSRLQALSSTFNPSAYLALRRALNDFQPDIVHVKMFLWQLSPSILPLLADIPSIYHAVTYKSICPNGMKILPDGRQCEYQAGKSCVKQRCLTPQSWLAMMCQQWLWKQGKSVFDAFLTPSAVVRQRLQANGTGLAEVIHNACVSRSIRAPLSEPPLLVYAGRLSPEKGVDTLLKAFAIVLREVPLARLLIAGDGPQRQSLELMAADLGISASVEFTGALEQQEMEQRFESAWVQVVPSIWEEPFGLVALEAMMRGTAVVASSNGAFAEFVDDGVCGYLTTPGDAPAMAGRLIQMLGDKNCCEQLGAAGHQRAVSRHSSEVYAENLESFYLATLEKRMANA